MARGLATEARDNLATDALMALGEQRISLGLLEKSQRNIEALQHGRAIERAELLADIDQIRQQLREHEERLRRFDEIDGQCDAIGVEIMQAIVNAEQQLAEDEQTVASDAKNAGFAGVHPDLLHPHLMVERRRQLRQSQQISSAEEDVI